VRAHSEFSVRHKGQRLTDLQSKAEELERELDDVRVRIQCGQSDDHDSATSPDQASSPESRTEALINTGRQSSFRHGLSRGHKLAMVVVLIAALLAALIIMLTRGGPSWPASVATVQTQINKACQNPDVKSEPGQVNFACAQGTRQILWVFALLTSGNNSNFADPKTGRIGLEPITPAQGGQVEWSLNLHNPYSPFNPIDSLEVAARAINSIIGGATVVGANGTSVVQAGLESSAANCLRYTGSAALTAHPGYPSLCAKPVTSVAGQGALVADVYQKWIPGADPKAAQNAALLFENANNPGNPQVQAILKQLPGSAQQSD
jgi:hypothetical protein